MNWGGALRGCGAATGSGDDGDGSIWDLVSAILEGLLESISPGLRGKTPGLVAWASNERGSTSISVEALATAASGFLSLSAMKTGFIWSGDCCCGGMEGGLKVLV